MVKSMYQLNLKYSEKYRLDYEFEVYKEYFNYELPSEEYTLVGSHIVSSKKKSTKRKKCSTKSSLLQ